MHGHTVVASSQSQVLLPFMDSPRRMEQLFSRGPGNDRHNDLSESSQIIGSSQSQIENELSLSMGASQIGLFPLPPAIESASQNVDRYDLGNEADSSISLPESMFLESIPRTPPNKRASRWRSLHIGSSPLSSAPHNSSLPTSSQENENIFHEKLSQEDHARDMTVHPETRSPSVCQTSALWPAFSNDKDLHDSRTESGSKSAVPELGREQRAFLGQAHSRVDSQVDVENGVGGIIQSSLVSEPAYYSSPPHRQSYGTSSQPLSEEDTQALYLAGAPLSISDFSLRTVATDDSTQSIPPAVRDFMDMFDGDGSYPRDFPMDLRC